MNNMKFKTYTKYKDSGIDWIGEIPEGWEVRKIKRISNTVAGGTPLTTKIEYWDGNIPWLPSGMIHSNIIKEEDVFKYITLEGLNNSSTKKINKNTPLIALTGATCGNVAYLTFEATANQSVVGIETNKEVNPKYIFYHLLSQREQILINKTGGAQSGINEQNVKNIFCSYPSLSEQTAIANFLDKKTAKIDALIEKDKRLIELLKERRAALINQAVTKGLDPNTKMKDSGVEWIGKIPEGWKTSRLRFLGDSIIGLTYSPNDIIEEGSNSNLILRASNIQNNKLSLHDNIYVNKKIPKKLITKKGDILICSRNGSRELIGKNICIDERTKGCSFGAFMTVYRTKYWRFMSMFFNSQVFKSQSSLFLTTTINQLTISTLNNFYVAIPSNIEEQLAIVSFLDKFTARIDKTIQKIEQKIKLLEKYKKSLIHHTVTGKIDVRGSEI